MTEYSPAFANRKEVPEDPFTENPASSDHSQVKPTFGLLVPPSSVPRYSSWRHDASRSNFLNIGKLRLSPNTVMFTWAKPAQTLYGYASTLGLKTKVPPV